MIAYKLLNPDLTTRGECQWVRGKWKRTSGEGDLCGPGWLHAYEHAEIAHFLNPLHANFPSPVLWTVEVDGTQKRDGQIKSGWTKMRLLAPHPLSIPRTEQRARFAIACSLTVYTDPSYRAWVEKWINGTDRSYTAATRAADAAYRATRAADAAYMAARAADAARAAYMAARAADAADAAAYAVDAADAARAAYMTARAAAYAVDAAAYAAAYAVKKPLSLVACAQWALSQSTELLV